VDQHAVAIYYVLYRLTQQGYAASPTTSGQADLMACTADGRRVVLVRVRARERGERFRMTPTDARPAGRNVAYVFVDFEGTSPNEPRVFVLRGALVTALVAADSSWPRDARAFASFEGSDEGWSTLGLDRGVPARSPSAVSSSPTLA
jgi:hypothetical protein